MNISHETLKYYYNITFDTKNCDVAEQPVTPISG